MKTRNLSVLNKIFLAVYALLILWHAFTNLTTISVQSLLLLILFSAGATLAWIAHSEESTLGTAFFVFHVAVEGCALHEHGFHMGIKEKLFHGVHLVFDAVFGYQLLRSRLSKRWSIILVAIGILLIGLFIVSAQPPELNLETPFQQHSTHSHESDPWIFIILGGAFGCVIAHLKE